MELSLLKADILSNNIPKFLIFNVEEPFLCKQYIQQMSNTLNKYYKYFDTADEILYETSSNFKEDYIYIALEDTNILKKCNYIDELIKTNRNIILYYNGMDKTSSFYNTYKKYIVNFSSVDKYTIVAYLLKAVKDDPNVQDISQDKLEELVDYCDCNFSKTMLEFEKIITLGQKKSTYVTDYMLHNGFSDYRKTNTFEFVQKILNKDESAFNDVLKITDSPITIFTILYKQARLRLLNTGNIVYSNIMQLCFNLDCGIKDGTVDANSALGYLLLKVM